MSTESRCGRGHLLNEANVYIRPDNGIVECRACRALNARELRRKLRASKPETEIRFRGGYPDEMTCRTCAVRKPQEQFTIKTRGVKGRVGYRNRSCKDCCAAKDRGYRLRRLYGISVAEYDQMLANQEGACALCESKPSGVDVLSVDHEHATGRVRGLLCQPCNIAVGFFEVRIDIERMQAYLSA